MTGEQMHNILNTFLTVDEYVYEWKPFFEVAQKVPQKFIVTGIICYIAQQQRGLKY